MSAYRVVGAAPAGVGYLRGAHDEKIVHHHLTLIRSRLHGQSIEKTPWSLATCFKQWMVGNKPSTTVNHRHIPKITVVDPQTVPCSALASKLARHVYNLSTLSIIQPVGSHHHLPGPITRQQHGYTLIVQALARTQKGTHQTPPLSQEDPSAERKTYVPKRTPTLTQPTRHSTPAPHHGPKNPARLLHLKNVPRQSDQAVHWEFVHRNTLCPSSQTR